MRKESKKERAAWSKFFGLETKEPSKYRNERQGSYDSKYEAQVAAKLWALQEGEKIEGLREQVPFVLVPGRDGVQPIIYVADFCFYENGKWKICDAKGYRKNAVWLLKKKMMFLIHGITVEEL
jgi:Protein of unknown function (DUF1064)